MYMKSTGSTVTIERALLILPNTLALPEIWGESESKDVTKSVEDASDTDRSIVPSVIDML